MRRTATLLLVLAVIFSVMTPCGVLAAEENIPVIEWASYNYVDADGNETTDTVLINDPVFPGYRIVSEDEMYQDIGLIMRVDVDGIDLAIRADGETSNLIPQNAQSVEVGVVASSCLSQIFEGTLLDSGRIALDIDARAFIVQDMRMLADYTSIYIQFDTGEIYGIALPHDGNFRELFDAEEERNWSSASVADNAGGTSSDTVTPEFKEKIDAYYQHFHDLAAEVQDANFQGGVGFLDIIQIAAQAWSDYEQFKEFGESATTQADKDYYEGVRSQVFTYLTTGALGAFAKNND